MNRHALTDKAFLGSTAKNLFHAGSKIVTIVHLLPAMLIILTIGCATPRIQPSDPQLLYRSDLLSFLKNGATTREEVVLKLGIPSAQIEGEKILMYQLRADKEGRWHLIAPGWNTYAALRTWSEGTCSLVLVFEENGLLQKHSLVTAQ